MAKSSDQKQQLTKKKGHHQRMLQFDGGLSSASLPLEMLQHCLEGLAQQMVVGNFDGMTSDHAKCIYVQNAAYFLANRTNGELPPPPSLPGSPSADNNDGNESTPTSSSKKLVRGIASFTFSAAVMIPVTVLF